MLVIQIVIDADAIRYSTLTLHSYQYSDFLLSNIFQFYVCKFIIK